VKSDSPRYLLDLNALIALADPDSVHYQAMQQWFDATGKEDWGVCPLTESGFVRVTTNPKYTVPGRTVAQATAILAEFASFPGYRYWAMNESWAEVTAPFSNRIKGHQQVTDAYLLGMAIRGNGVLVTFDASIAYLAGKQFAANLLTLRAQLTYRSRLARARLLHQSY
jgi:toxin-antitoxin system PIN domain toxin